MNAHNWYRIALGKRSTAGFPWPVCRHCGAVWLGNDRSDAIARRSCAG